MSYFQIFLDYVCIFGERFRKKTRLRKIYIPEIEVLSYSIVNEIVLNMKCIGNDKKSLKLKMQKK